MATNISKYVQINDFLLLEYEFNRDNVETFLSSPRVVTDEFGIKLFFESDSALGITNNILPLNSIPENAQRTSWFIDYSTYEITYPSYWDSSVVITTISYPCDNIKVHIISGYNFEDIEGFLLQIKAKDSSGYLVSLSNFTYIKQPQTFGNKVIKFNSNALFLGNRFYDKYVEFSIPSIYNLGAKTIGSGNIETILNIASLSDVYITYSGINEITDNKYFLDEQINLQLPVTSIADNFNCFIAESTNGDFIEYYATWNNDIIGDWINDIESGRIALYTSNIPNDNYQEFVNIFGENARKWIIIHEISVFEQLANNTSLLTQKFSFTQDSAFAQPNYFRPIIKYADIAVSYMIQYVCRLTNRLDGTQIIRKASYVSNDPKKYGLTFTRLNIDNIIPYKVFNKVEAEKPNIITKTGVEKTKYVKVFYDTTNILMNAFNEIFPQGTGPLFLKSFDSLYKFKFEKIDINGNKINVDLSGSFNYALQFKLDDNTKIEISPTYSTNMNTTLGELEFKLTENQLSVLKKQKNNSYSIIVKNPDGTSYTFYEGIYYDILNQDQIIQQYKNLYTITDMQSKIAELEAEIQRLNNELSIEKTK